MATYKGIQGYSVQSLASDPSPTASVVGQLWYNSGSNVWKYASEGDGTWAASNPLNTGRHALGAQTGIQTAALCMDGRGPESTLNVTETYDGSSWTEVADSVAAVYDRASFGTQTATIAAGGQGPPASNLTESWDGSTWTNTGNNIGTARRNAVGSGTATAGLIVAGNTGSIVANTETYDGSSWTEVGDANTARSEAGGAGNAPQTAGLIFGGYTPPYSITDVVESWNGTSWTEVGDLIVANTYMAGAGDSQDSALCIAGRSAAPAYTATTEEFDGTSWTEVGDLASARSSMGGCGTTSSALCFGGYLVGVINLTEEWDKSVGASSFTSS